MSELAQVISAVAAHERSVTEQVRRVRQDSSAGRAIRNRWAEITARASATATTTPTGIKLPRVALPQADEPGTMAQFLYGEGLPGEFPFVNGAYPEMYLQSDGKVVEEPTRLFAGLGLAEDTNQRFHYLSQHQQHVRLSTAFDGPTLYGMDSDADGVFGKIGEGGVAIDTVEDMERLYAGFPVGDPHSSVSMTINGPAPIILAMYVAAARRRFGPTVVAKLRGTVQADVLKEVQAQNEMIFPIEPALRFLGDMVQYTIQHMPRWYPISISGYHIAEAGATPVQQAAYTLSNGFAYAQMFRQRGMDVNTFGPRLSFFLDCGLDIEYLAMTRVCRKIWAVGMRDVFGADAESQKFKVHTQTSGRSLIASEFKNNLTRTAVELVMAYANGTNSSHSNSADEPFTTPGEEYVRLASHAQSIILEESGLFRHMMNALAGSPGMKIVETAVEEGILAEFEALERLGGVLPAVEHRYQRSQIQAAAHRYERQIYSGERPIIGLNKYKENGTPEVHVVRTAHKKKQLQVDRLHIFKKKNRAAAAKALDELSRTVESGGNVFGQLVETVEVCSLGQIVVRLQEMVGKFRPMV